MWFIMALLSSVFAAATSILAKIGIEGVNSNLATVLRTAVVLIMGAEFNGTLLSMRRDARVKE